MRDVERHVVEERLVVLSELIDLLRVHISVKGRVKLFVPFGECFKEVTQ